MRHLLLALLILPLFFCSQTKDKPKEVVLRGINYGRSLIVENPFKDVGTGYSLQELLINDRITVDEINKSVFEIDLKEDGWLYKAKVGDSIKITLQYYSKYAPRFINPESVTNPSIETIKPLPGYTGSNQSYYLEDKICLISGKLELDSRIAKWKPDSALAIWDYYTELYERVNDSLKLKYVNGASGKYLFIAEFDSQYELWITDTKIRKPIKKILVDLRGVPENQKRGQVINLDLLIPKITDQREALLYSEFPINKLYYSTIQNTLKWDDDYANAVSSSYQILSKQLVQEGELKEKGDEVVQQRKQRRYLIAIIGFIILVSAVSIFAYLKQKKLRKLIALQKHEVERQKHLVEEKHREITDSIHYAERIQRSFMATQEMLDEHLKDYFVLFQPKDVVSGDFYWAATLTNGNFALATADSTGHGVPGAIMSLLNISSLEKSIEKETEPAAILNTTRKIIIERLKKDGSPEGGKDGMDCSLLVFDLKNMQFTYTAANNPVWIVRDTQIIELMPDKMPVGKHDRDSVSFIQHVIPLKQDDMIYTITDGMPDQFGGPKGKKFMYKKLKDLLISNAKQSTHAQKELLVTSLNAWKGELEQVDDITVIGIRV